MSFLGIHYLQSQSPLIFNLSFGLISFELIEVMTHSLKVSEQSSDYFLKQLLAIVVT